MTNATGGNQMYPIATKRESRPNPMFHGQRNRSILTRLREHLAIGSSLAICDTSQIQFHELARPLISGRKRPLKGVGSL